MSGQTSSRFVPSGHQTQGRPPMPIARKYSYNWVSCHQGVTFWREPRWRQEMPHCEISRIQRSGLFFLGTLCQTTSFKTRSVVRSGPRQVREEFEGGQARRSRGTFRQDDQPFVSSFGECRGHDAVLAVGAIPLQSSGVCGVSRTSTSEVIGA